MRQEINLYQEGLEGARDPAPAGRLLVLLASLAVLLALGWAFQWWRVQDLGAQREALAAVKAEREAGIAELERRFPKPQKSRLLEQEVERLAAELERKRRLADAIAGGELGDRRGFARYLEGLARQHVEGTWLTEVRIADGGRALALGGRALAAPLVPAYVQRLAGEEVFAGRAFSNLLIRRGEREAAEVVFSLRTPGVEALALEEERP